jgi:hypothetical protein
VSVTIDEALVVPLLAGTLDVEAAIDRGEIEVHGSPAALEGWAQAFASELKGIQRWWSEGDQ